MTAETEERKVTKAKSKKTEKADKKEPTLEERMQRLEEVVDALGRPGTDLGDALKLYKEGVTLADGCLAELEGVEKELQILEAEADSVSLSDDN